MDFEFSESEELIRSTVREYAEREMAPRVMEFDEAAEFPMDIIKGLGELGVMGLLFPSELGGAEAGPASRHNSPFSVASTTARARIVRAPGLLATTTPVAASPSVRSDTACQ